jgi:biopolymer transport protein ExbD
MKIRNASDNVAEKIDIPMTPMIDIVFQLLVFFIMTFKIVSMEGDFNIKQPSASKSEGEVEDPMLPIDIKLLADEDGNLLNIKVADRNFGKDFNELRMHIVGLAGSEDGPDSFRETVEVQIDPDYDLKYKNVIAALTSVTGHRAEGGEIISLMKKVKLAQPRKTE